MSVANIFKNHPKKMLLCLLLVVQFLNFSGFCYSEGRYLSEEELMKKVFGKLYEDNPGCCYISSENGVYETALWHFINNLFGRHLHLAEKVQLDDEPSEPQYPYRISTISVDVCGKGYLGYGERISEKEYLARYGRKTKGENANANRN